MGQHGVELFTLPNCFVIINPQQFYFAIEDDVSNEGGGWAGEAIIVQPQLSDGEVIVIDVFVENMQTAMLYIANSWANWAPSTACRLGGRGIEEDWYTLDVSHW